MNILNLKFGNKNIIDMNYGTVPILALYHNSILLWEQIKSCFGKGFWINDKPWINNDCWKNG